MKRRYNVNYKGKNTVVIAEDAEDAIDRFCNREFFGNRRIFTYKITQIDADTRGVLWAEAYGGDSTANRNKRIVARLIRTKR